MGPGANTEGVWGPKQQVGCLLEETRDVSILFETNLKTNYGKISF